MLLFFQNLMPAVGVEQLGTVGLVDCYTYLKGYLEFYVQAYIAHNVYVTYELLL